MNASQRVTRWAPTVQRVLSAYGLDNVPVWVVLAQIHVESSGWMRPEKYVSVDYAAEGLLQITPIAARDCGVPIADVDGLRTPYGDAVRSIQCWAKLQKRYNGTNAKVWDYALLWLAGAGALSRSKDLRGQYGYWDAWYIAANNTSGRLDARYLYDYATKWYEAALAYYRWSQGGRA